MSGRKINLALFLRVLLCRCLLRKESWVNPDVCVCVWYICLYCEVRHSIIWIFKKILSYHEKMSGALMGFWHKSLFLFLANLQFLVLFLFGLCFYFCLFWVGGLLFPSASLTLRSSEVLWLHKERVMWRTGWSRRYPCRAVVGTVGGMCSVSVHSSLRFSFSPQTDSQAEIAHCVKERERGSCLKGGQFSNKKHFLVWGRSREGTSFILFYFTVFLFSWVSGSIDILKGVQFFKIYFLNCYTGVYAWWEGKRKRTRAIKQGREVTDIA